MKLFGLDIPFSLPKRREPGPEEMVCFGCGQDGNDSKKLIAGPLPVFICDRCVARAEAVRAGDDRSGTRDPTLKRVEGHRCSFCNKPLPIVTAGGGTGICEECITICQKIIAADRSLDP